MLNIKKLVAYLDELLAPNEYKDYCPNGLQVEGVRDITTLVTGVTACQLLIEKAIALQADALLVHHGYFWKGEDPRLIGMYGNRVRQLMTHGIHLLAYHLPLDGHKTLGNNVQLAKQLGIEVDGLFDIARCKMPLGFKGKLTTPMRGEALAELIHQRLKRKPFYVVGGETAPTVIKTIGWCTGGAQDFIIDAANAGLDAYITGEASERTVHIARESGIHLYVAGHHATERYGVIALGEHLAETFRGIKHINIDIDNPI